MKARTRRDRRDDLNRMGSYIAPMAQCDAAAAPEEMSSGDLETWRLYGARVAEVATRLLKTPRA